MQERLQHNTVDAEDQAVAAMGEQEKLTCLPDVEIISPDQESRDKDPKYKREAGHFNWNQNIDKINQAIAGLASGQYGSWQEASQALGFNKSWLSIIKRSNPIITERLEEACATPAFQKASRVRKNKRAKNKGGNLKSFNQKTPSGEPRANKPSYRRPCKRPI